MRWPNWFRKEPKLIDLVNAGGSPSLNYADTPPEYSAMCVRAFDFWQAVFKAMREYPPTDAEVTEAIRFAIAYAPFPILVDLAKLRRTQPTLTDEEISSFVATSLLPSPFPYHYAERHLATLEQAVRCRSFGNQTLTSAEFAAFERLRQATQKLS